MSVPAELITQTNVTICDSLITNDQKFHQHVRLKGNLSSHY